MKGLSLITAILLLSGPVLAGPQSGIIVRTAEVKQTPTFSAPTSNSLAPGTQVQVHERQGGWQKIKIPATPYPVEGWVRTYQVRTDIQPSANSVVVQQKDSKGGVLGGLADLSRGASGLLGRREMDANRNDQVATIGIRGLSEEDLEKAKPNPEELKKLNDYGASADSARQYAELAGLQTQKVEVLSEPEAPRKRRRK
jgi:hypothetical protein